MTAIAQDQLFQNYAVIRVLGEGSFGKVFLIRNEKTDVEYAMKKYSKYHIFKNGKENSLIRSVRILQALSNIGIVDFIHYGIGSDDEIFLIFEACKKGSLEEIKVRIFKCMDIRLIREIMYQLALALQYLKSVSVAHRDLKPSNISFSSEGQLKIIDFDEAVCFNDTVLNRDVGFAESLNHDTASMKFYSRRSRVNSYVGTEIYMSPEMRLKTITDERGDLWAYGCIFFQLVAGRSIIIDSEDEEDIDMKISVDLSTLKRHLEQTDLSSKDIEGIVDLLKKVLRNNPDERLRIDEMLNHQFFQEYLVASNRDENKKKLRKFLRGNYNLSDPRGLNDALKMDLIGMKEGKQKFQFLSNVPIYVRYIKVEHLKQSICLQIVEKFRNFVEWGKSIKFPNFYFILGGGAYFKLKNNKDKIYIFYDEVDSIKIENNKIMIDCGYEKKWGNQKRSIIKWRYEITHISGSLIDLGLLYQILIYVLND